jgi:hypothetical protein
MKKTIARALRKAATRLDSEPVQAPTFTITPPAPPTPGRVVHVHLNNRLYVGLVVIVESQTIDVVFFEPVAEEWKMGRRLRTQSLSRGEEMYWTWPPRVAS